jgi:hypothetical protein
MEYSLVTTFLNLLPDPACARPFTHQPSSKPRHDAGWAMSERNLGIHQPSVRIRDRSLRRRPYRRKL